MIVYTQDQLHEAVGHLKEFEEFVFDVETKGPYRGVPLLNEVFWISLAGPGYVATIPMGHPLGSVVDWDIPMRKDGKGPLKNRKPIPIFGPVPDQLWPGDVFDALRPLLFSDRRKIGHNVKFDLQSVAKYYEGELPPPPYGDTMLLAHILNENHHGYLPYSLGSCVKREFGYEYDKSVGRIGPEKFPFNEAGQYSFLDGRYDWLLWRTLIPDLEAEGLVDLYETEMAVLKVVCDMELEGVSIDVAAIKKLDIELGQQIAEVYARIKAAAGWEINLNANAEVAKLVYEVQGHKPTMFTEKTQQPSTTAKAFEPYLDDPVVADVKEWGNLHKIHSTYVVNIIPQLIDGKLHANFKQHGTKTGRFSCAEPNLQNIPIRQNKLIRDLFVAPEGFVLIVADYSQIELRLLAHFSGDPLLIKAYTEGLDLHRLTAQRAYGVEEPTFYQRAQGKNTNFAMAYGATAKTISFRYDVPLREAEKLVQSFWTTYTRVQPWVDSVIRECKRNRVSREKAELLGTLPQPPHITTLLGRKRRLPEIFYADYKLRGYAERQAVNTKIQGSAADVNKLAMIRAGKLFEGTEAHLILSVHDELVTVVPKAKADETAILVTEAMEGVTEALPVALKVPLTADVKIVSRWSEAK